MTSDRPPPPWPEWLPRAWRVRAVLLGAILGLLTLIFFERWTASGREDGWRVLAIGAVLIGGALAIDWFWLKRNHHRVNEWGLSRGKNARKKRK